MIEGRSPEGIKTLLDAIHRTVLAAFKVPVWVDIYMSPWYALMQ